MSAFLKFWETLCECRLNKMKLTYLHSVKERVIKVSRFCVSVRESVRQTEEEEETFQMAADPPFSLSGYLLCCPVSHINETRKALLSLSH